MVEVTETRLDSSWRFLMKFNFLFFKIYPAFLEGEISLVEGVYVLISLIVLDRSMPMMILSSSLRYLHGGAKFWSTKDPGQQPFSFRAATGSVSLQILPMNFVLKMFKSSRNSKTYQNHVLLSLCFPGSLFHSNAPELSTHNRIVWNFNMETKRAEHAANFFMDESPKLKRESEILRHLLCAPINYGSTTMCRGSWSTPNYVGKQEPCELRVKYGLSRSFAFKSSFPVNWALLLKISHFPDEVSIFHQSCEICFRVNGLFFAFIH